jgi:NADH:ubiquinone oxidoreductase subunit
MFILTLSPHSANVVFHRFLLIYLFFTQSVSSALSLVTPSHLPRIMVLNVIHQVRKAAHHRGGWRKLVQHMYSNGDYPFKFGTFKGSDASGNKYFENVHDYPFGQHRWVEPADIHNYDASSISPEWHGWMVSMYDTPGDKLDEAIALSEAHQIKGVRASKELQERVPITLGYQQPPLSVAKQHLQMSNQSQMKERGFMVGNTVTQFPPGGTEQYYKQPGHPMNKNADKGGRFVETRQSISKTIESEKIQVDDVNENGRVRSLTANDNSWPVDEKGEVRAKPDYNQMFNK